MYHIEKTKIGAMDTYQMEFGGFIKLDEMNEWVSESEKALQSSPSQFAVTVDMRELKPLP